ncbi:C2H2-like zinc finger protein [Euphorbia peplus]|nr:C2H2-like zinc finger protein [Euphorbia peplus]
MTNPSKETPPPSPPKDTNPNEKTEGTLASPSPSSSPSKTPPQAIIPSGPGGSSGGDSSVKNKGKKKDDQQVVKKRKVAQMDAPKSEPICSLCGKKFATWKGVFGHLRAHPERPWRGAFPPPKGDTASWLPLGLPPEQILAPALWEAAHAALAKMRREQTEGSSGVGTLDLNKEPPEEPPVALPPPSLLLPPPPPPQSGLDLNLTPSPGTEDEELDRTDE